MFEVLFSSSTVALIIFAKDERKIIRLLCVKVKLFEENGRLAVNDNGAVNDSLHRINCSLRVEVQCF